MATGANVLRLPVPEETICCHVTVPNATALLRAAPDEPTGMSSVAVAMQQVAERFDDLAIVFEECPEASYVPHMHILDGHLTFVFRVPRRYRDQLVRMGWTADDIDVRPEDVVSPGRDGRVPT